MNRRNFIAAGAATALTPYLIGCDTTTVAEFVSLIGTDAQALANYFGADSLGTQIVTLAGSIATDLANWKPGTPAQTAIQSINDLIGLVGQIPIAAPYAPLIILILSALSGLLALLPSSATNAVTAKSLGRYHVTPARYGGFDKHSMSAAKSNFTLQWKQLTAQYPVTK